MKKTDEKKQEQLSGIVVSDFRLKKKKYRTGMDFKTKDLKTFEHLSKTKRIRRK